MEKQQKKARLTEPFAEGPRNFETTNGGSVRLLSKILHLHPELSFCGEPKSAILSVADGLLSYVLSLLKNDPVRPPQAPLSEWAELLHILESHWITPLLH